MTMPYSFWLLLSREFCVTVKFARLRLLEWSIRRWAIRGYLAPGGGSW